MIITHPYSTLHTLRIGHDRQTPGGTGILPRGMYLC